MVQSIGHYVNLGAQALEFGLSHSTFLGRAVSWGVFYGALYFVAKKVHQYAWPKIEAYFTRTCQFCKEKILAKKIEKPEETEGCPVEEKGTPHLADEPKNKSVEPGSSLNSVVKKK